MTHNTYDRAVAAFETLVMVPLTQRHLAPSELIQSAGLAVTSGYRHISTLEAEGFLRRDETGVYLVGAAAQSIGLRANGVGWLAPLAHPILLQLRQATRNTSFLGFVSDGKLQIGPFSIGRQSRQVPIEPVFGVDGLAAMTLGKVAEVSLSSRKDGILRRFTAFVTPIGETGDTTAVLGLFLTTGRAHSDVPRGQLLHAVARLTQARDPGCEGGEHV